MERKDLDYLQWLQQNARVYLTGMAILTFLIALSFCLFFSNPWQPHQQQGVAFWLGDKSDETVAEQKVPEEKKDDAQNSSKDAVTPLSNQQSVVQADKTGNEKQNTVTQQTKQDQGAEVDQQIDHEKIQQDLVQSQERVPAVLEITTTDPLQLEGFTAPCKGELVYAYGVGYDPQLEDYRFHDAVCYRANGEQVTAVTDGIVQQAALEQTDQLVVQYDHFMIIYKGLQTCCVAAGETITAGQILGTSGEYAYVKAIQQ